MDDGVSVRPAAEARQRLEHRHVRLAGAVLLEAPAAGNRDLAVGFDLREEGLHERGLADARLARHEHDLPVPAERLVEQPAQAAKLSVAADHCRWNGRRGLPGRRRGARCALWPRRGNGREREPGVLSQHLPFQLPERLRGLDAELLVQLAAEVLVAGKGLRLAAGAVEGEHLLPVEPLPQGVTAQQGVELTNELGVATAREVGLDPLLDCCQAELLDAGALHLGERLLELGERRSAPERDGVREQV